MADTFASFATRCDKMAEGLSGPLMRKVIVAIGVAAKTDVVREVRAGVGADQKFTGWTASKAKIGAGFEVDSDSAFTLYGRPGVMMVVLTDGRRRGARVARRGAYKGRRVGWGPTAGKGTFTHAVARIRSEMPARTQIALTRAIAHNFGV